MSTSVKNKVSQTASYTCFCRACADAERDARFRGPDYIAKEFIPFLPKVLFMKCGPVKRLVLKRIMPSGVYEYVSARTKLIDELVIAAIEEGFPQVVILGAGFDTRAWRFERYNPGTKIFELDEPVTQAMKKKLLLKKGFPLPRNAVFVPVDFEKEDIAAVLRPSGYRSDVKSLFLCEGLFMYLSAEAVDGTLEFIRRHAAAGSRLVFDYILASVIRRENTLYGESSIHGTVFKAGERWKFGIEAGAIGPFLSGHGFKLVAHYRPADLQQQFLTAADGTLFGRVNETHCVALAAVDGAD